MHQLEELRREIEGQRLNQEQLLSNEEKDYNAQLERLKSQSEQNRNREIAEIRALEAEKKLIISGIEFEIRGWEEQFHNRGPRPEDLDQIRQLEEMIRERTEAYEKVVGETRRIQTELHEMEVSMNKVFTSKPRAQLLSALERKARHDQMIAQAAGSARLPPIERRSDKNLTSPR
jgi:hypothetical protein